MGQILPGTVLGDYLYNIVKRPDVKTIVEVGTGDGLGSTLRIYEGLRDCHKIGFRVLSLEADKNLYEQAKKNVPAVRGFSIVRGTLIKSLKPFEEYDKKYFGDPEKLMHAWYLKEIEYLKEAELITIKVPSIDLLILDGDEFASQLEYDILAPKSKIIVLDDSLHLKNAENRLKCLSDQSLKPVLDVNNKNDGRNGYCVFERLR